MRVAVLARRQEPCSLRIYYDNITRELSTLGVEIIPFGEGENIPVKVEFVWDPGMCMRRIPRIFSDSPYPLIGTMHGVKAFSLPLEELTTGPQDSDRLRTLKENLIRDWNWFRGKATLIVAVSRFAAEEVVSAFRLPSELVQLVYNGIDPSVFNTEGEFVNTGRPYFLVVSRFDPIKNLARVFAAYRRLDSHSTPDLVAVVPPDLDPTEFFPHFSNEPETDGIHLIQDELSQQDLARLYRGALCLVFPSLRETFGMPIVEAMACGCPVITSNVTACPEVAGNAALLVNPRSVEEIAEAMRCLATDRNLLKLLREKGLGRARRFTWRQSAEKFLKILSSSVHAKV